jgi:hypothetical protein
VRGPLGAHMTVAAMSSGATFGKKVWCSTRNSHDGEPSFVPLRRSITQIVDSFYLEVSTYL